MMIHAYQELYLSKAQSVLGDAFEYAICTCKMPGKDFIKLFVASMMSKRMENGEPACLAGKSGVEIVQEILAETKGQEVEAASNMQDQRPPEYWMGWAIAYYQWFSNKRYCDIFSAVTYDDLHSMYTTLHEADISKFVSVMDVRMEVCFSETNLKRIRKEYGFTQAELAKASGVNLRCIQLYEQRNKNINKAGADTIYRFAKVLGCAMEDLMEF